jgi:ArsR family transcriptional regulator
MNFFQPMSNCCKSVLSGLIKPEEAVQTATIFKVLGEPARLQLLSFIANQPTGEACVCELTEPLGLSQPTVSHHMKILHDAGLISRDKRGLWVWYRIVPERLEALRAVLATTD